MCIKISILIEVRNLIFKTYIWMRNQHYLKGYDTLLAIFCLSEDFLRAINKNLSGRKWGGGRWVLAGGKISPPPTSSSLTKKAMIYFLT